MFADFSRTLIHVRAREGAYTYLFVTLECFCPRRYLCQPPSRRGLHWIESLVSWARLSELIPDFIACDPYERAATSLRIDSLYQHGCVPRQSLLLWSQRDDHYGGCLCSTFIFPEKP